MLDPTREVLTIEDLPPEVGSLRIKKAPHLFLVRDSRGGGAPVAIDV